MAEFLLYTSSFILSPDPRSMVSLTFPLGTITFQFFFLLVAIAVEAFVFQRLLNLNPKTSVAYAASVNLFSTVVGWLIFFILEPLLTIEVRSALISYIFFDTVPDPNQQFSSSITFGILVFFLTFIIKFALLQLLQILLMDPPKDEKNERTERPRLKKRAYAGDIQASSKASAVLLATSCSFSAIILILIIRSFARQTIAFG